VNAHLKCGNVMSHMCAGFLQYKEVGIAVYDIQCTETEYETDTKLLLDRYPQIPDNRYWEQKQREVHHSIDNGHGELQINTNSLVLV
jgi:hypothetical protein